MRYFPFILVMLLCSTALAVPDAVNRVLKSLDFEERKQGNNEDLPMYWNKVEGPSLPHYVNGLLATDRARSGRYSFRFDLNGGGLIYRYESGQIPVQRGAHYRVETYVQTTPLPHARARLSAYFTDVDHHKIEDSQAYGELFAQAAESNPGDPWKHLSVELSTRNETAAYLVIELALLQPEHYTPTTLGQRALFSQDIHGSAWFDDVKVSQVPKVRIGTDHPGNIFRRDEAASLLVEINDRFTDDLAGVLEVSDALGKVVYQRSGALDMNTAERVEAGEYRVKMQLPALEPGWYRATLRVSSHGESIGDHVADLVQLADRAGQEYPDDRFGVIASDLPFGGWSDLPDLLPFLSAGRVKLGVWTKEGDIQQVDPKGFDRLIERLKEKRITPTACLVDLPPVIARQLAEPTWTGLLKARADIWQPQLSQLISRQAENLAAWQLGPDGSDAFVVEPRMREVYDKLYERFAMLIRRPDLAMPWPAWYELDGSLPATVALSIPPSVLPSQIPLYVGDLRGGRGKREAGSRKTGDRSNGEVSVTLELLDRERYGRELQIRDIAQRIVFALSAGVKRIDLPLPFEVQVNGDRVLKQPQEMFIILRTLTRTLSGATFMGKVPIAEGVEAFLFDRSGQGILVLWGLDNQRGNKQLQVNLGPQVVRLDLWGNATAVPRPRIDDGSADEIDLPIDATPIFLIGIDANLARMRASVAFDRPLIESSFKPHLRKIRFVNPYQQTISGNLRLRAPAGWTINPPTFQFSLNPGETFERELTIELPYNSVAGMKTVEAEVEVRADRNSRFRVALPLKLGLSDVGVQTLALRDGNDIIVQQMISNYGEKPIDYAAFTMYPGQARQERLVTQLEPGKTTIKRYRFENVQFTPGATVRCGIKETYGTRILNDEVPIQ